MWTSGIYLVRIEAIDGTVAKRRINRDYEQKSFCFHKYLILSVL